MGSIHEWNLNQLELRVLLAFLLFGVCVIEGPTSTGQDLLDVVVKHLNLLETSYFGLKYLEPASNAGEALRKTESVWLDMNRSALKQLRDINPMTVYFGVKYYATDPCKLAEEITRYQFFLQCKQDILHSRLPVPLDLAIELFALAVQSELGDFDPQRHQDGYVAEFQFVPNQTLELERRVALFHRNLSGQVPASAEMNFLERVKWLDLYGCELHPIQYEDNGEEYALGLNPTGVLVLRNRLRVAQYLWPRIVKTKCQGRCFLMDVIDNKATGGDVDRSARNRFGFRLANKEASQRLRWAIEEHKSFHHLVHDSATLNQLAKTQQQQFKLSQRFRNSIRGAIGLVHNQHGGPSASTLNLQQQQRLRASVKSMGSQVAANQQQLAAMQQQQHLAAMGAHNRPQPTVVRMPSRRYSNRSLNRANLPFNIATANGNGLPNVSLPRPPPVPPQIGSALTMVSGQRQQALMMMNQFHQMNQSGALISRSHTLKPVSSAAKQSAKEAMKNPYYQMMMMTAANSSRMPDVTFLPPGRHIVQPSIYKASSVVNGLNQLGEQPVGKEDLRINSGPRNAGTMGQFFGNKGHYSQYQSQAGHESPRSTKSAIAPSAAIKLASKRLMKQQQQFLYGNQNDVQPLLAYDLSDGQRAQMYPADCYNATSLGYASANVSPRSVRSARVAANQRHKSRSTMENLHLLHEQQNKYNANLITGSGDNKMLLATTHQLMQQNVPPPDYHGSSRRSQQPVTGTIVMSNGKRQPIADSEKRAPFSPDQAKLLLNANGLGQQPPPPRPKRVVAGKGVVRYSDGEGDDDYCCSRSDCSSVDTGGNCENGAASLRRQDAALSRNRRPSVGADPKSAKRIDGQQEWDAIRKRHDEFSSGKGYLAGERVFGQDANNNDAGQTQTHLLKNIANKQATPILLSMNYEQSNANSRAVQLLNLQRQQLNSQSSVGSSDGGNKSSSSVVDSTPSSLASSPQAAQGGATRNGRQGVMRSDAKAPHSTSSTTSGYYAGSNSTGSAAGDSDNSQSGGQKQQQPRGYSNDWQDEAGSRAKCALGQYSKGESQKAYKSLNQSTTNPSSQRQFYLGERDFEGQTRNQDAANSNNKMVADRQQQWSPLNQIQQHAPSSLKYVSFDV